MRGEIRGMGDGGQNPKTKCHKNLETSIIKWKEITKRIIEKKFMS